MRSAPLAAALLLLAAGCLGDAGPTGTEDTTEPDMPEGGSGATTFYLTGSMGLTQAEPSGEPERVPVGSFYTAWAQGEEQPTWAGDGIDRTHRFTSADLTFFYTADRAVATTGPQDQGFPEFVVYVGTEAAPMAWASVEGPDVVQNDEIVEVTASLELPRGGLVLPAGAEPVVKIAPVQAQADEADPIVILVEGEQTPSRATLEGEPIELAATTGERALDETGILAGSAYATGASEGTTAQSFEVEVPEDGAGVRAWLNRTEGAGIADIDLEVLGPEGEVVARSVTPEDDEGVALYRPNVEAIGSGTWTLRVVNYGNAAVEFELQATSLSEGERPAAGGEGV